MLNNPISFFLSLGVRFELFACLTARFICKNKTNVDLCICWNVVDLFY